MNDSSPQLSTDLDASINPEVQEALSIRYSVAAVVAPLTNGKFAVFANDRTLDSLVICELEDLPIVITARANMAPKKTNVPKNIAPAEMYKVDFSSLL